MLADLMMDPLEVFAGRGANPDLPFSSQDNSTVLAKDPPKANAPGPKRNRRGKRGGRRARPGVKEVERIPAFPGGSKPPPPANPGPSGVLDIERIEALRRLATSLMWGTPELRVRALSSVGDLAAIRALQGYADSLRDIPVADRERILGSVLPRGL